MYHHGSEMLIRLILEIPKDQNADKERQAASCFKLRTPGVKLKSFVEFKDFSDQSRE